MEKSRKMDKFKNILIVVIIFYSINCLAQSIENPRETDFYVVDTIMIKNPVAFYIPNQSGQFLGDIDVIKSSRFNLKKAVKKENLYIYSNSLYGFLSSEKIKKYRYPDYGNCEYAKGYFKDIKGIVYQKFKKQPTKFILALVNVAYYNRKINAVGEKPTIFSKCDKSLYYKIVFPLCE